MPGYVEEANNLKALGIDATAAEARPIFDEADKDKSGAIELHEVAGIVAGVAHMRQGRAADGARRGWTAAQIAAAEQARQFDERKKRQELLAAARPRPPRRRSAQTCRRGCG